MNKNNLPVIPVPAAEKVSGWGMFNVTKSPVLYPKTEKEIQEILEYANARKIKITLRGGGYSYGDPAVNSKGLVVNLSQFNKILDFDSKKGIIRVQAGATIRQIWEAAIVQSFWPPVVSGTMYPTLGGALSMNIHGKNNFAVGPIGEHILSFTFITASGKIMECSAQKNSELFYSAISGFGMLGVFTTITLKLKPIVSGKMKVTAVATRNLAEMIAYFEKEYERSDYLVGWVDAFAGGSSIGRGQIHKGELLKKGEDSDYPGNLALEKQHLPSTLFGVVPKSWMWLLLFPFNNNLGMRFVNLAKYILSVLGNNKVYTQGHAEFQFLLDYVPGWKKIYKPGSLIQYQLFVPKENALQTFESIFRLCQKKGIISYLAVFKKHRPDRFLMTHAVDGYSMAMDFPVTARNRKKLRELVFLMDEIAVANKARFYFAKDSQLRPEITRKVFGNQTLQKFQSLKKKYDPKGILESDLYRRIFGIK